MSTESESAHTLAFHDATTVTVIRLPEPEDPAAQGKALRSLDDATTTPVFVSDKDWAALASNDFKQIQVDNGSALLARSKEVGHPRALRRTLIEQINQTESLLEIVPEAVSNVHLVAETSATAVEQVLRVLFAAKGLGFDGTPAALALLEDHFAPKLGTNAAENDAWLRLRSLAHRARYLEHFNGQQRQTLGLFEAIKDAGRLLSAIRRYAMSELSTAAEQKKRRTFRFAALGVFAAICAGAGIYAFIATRPILPITDTSAITNVGGIRAQYFNGKNFEKKVTERDERVISLSTSRSPLKGVNADRFSVRWDGYLQFQKSGKHTVCAESDDGSRVFLGGDLVLDNWQRQARKKKCTTVRVKAGWHKMRAEFFDDAAGAFMRLMVGDSERKARLVRAKNLCCMSKAAPQGRKPPRPRLPRTGVTVGKPGAKPNLGKPTSAPVRPGSMKPGAKPGVVPGGAKPGMPKPGAAKPGATKPKLPIKFPHQVGGSKPKPAAAKPANSPKR